MPESHSIVCVHVQQHKTLAIFNLVFDPLTLTCMFMIEVIAQSFCLILGQATHTKKTQLSPLRGKDGEYRKRL